MSRIGEISNMRKIILLQGPPATGKSTFRKQFLADNPEWQFVSLDLLRDRNPEKAEHEHIEAMWSIAQDYASAGISFIVDNTNLNPKMVEKWYYFAARNNYTVDIKQFFDVPYETAVERDSKRINPVGKSVIWKMYVDAGLDPSRYPGKKLWAIICDIDGTIANLEHRRHHVVNKPKDWDAFYSEMHNDEVFKHISELLDLYNSQDYYIILVSGRPAKYRRETEQWLKEHNVVFDLLLMRGFNDKRDDTIVKEEIYDRYIAPFFNIRLVLDDRDRVVQMWRNKGLYCLQVAPGDF